MSSGLTISEASVDFLPDDVLADLPNLTKFLIGECPHLDRLPKKFLINERKLKVLAASFNGLKILQRDLFKTNLKLEELYLNGNNLKKIYVDFTRLTALKIIDLNLNKCISQKWETKKESIQLFQDKINRQCQPTRNF